MWTKKGYKVLTHCHLDGSIEKNTFFWWWWINFLGSDLSEYIWIYDIWMIARHIPILIWTTQANLCRLVGLEQFMVETRFYSNCLEFPLIFPSNSSIDGWLKIPIWVTSQSLLGKSSWWLHEPLNIPLLIDCYRGWQTTWFTGDYDNP